MKQTFYIPRNAISLLLCCSLVLPASRSVAQTTITLASYSGWTPGADTNRQVSANSVTAVNNGNWDLSSAVYGMIDPFVRVPVSGDASYPSATYSVPGNYSFNSLLAYDSEEMNGITAAGLQGFGQRLARQPISIAGLTGGANDSLVFVQQDIIYSAPKTKWDPLESTCRHASLSIL